MQDAAKLLEAEGDRAAGTRANLGTLSGMTGLMLGPGQHGAALIGRLMKVRTSMPGEQELYLTVQVWLLRLL